MREKVSSKFVRVVFVCLMVGLTFSALPSTVSAAEFSVGDTVEVINTLNVGLSVRDAPAGNLVDRKFDGSRGTILAGPRTAASGGITYTWWKIQWNDALVGWSAERWPGGVYYLKKVTTTPTLGFTSLTPSTIRTSTAPHNAILSASGTNFNNVNRVTFTWSGAVSGSATWNRGDSSWRGGVTVNSDTSMTLRPRVVEPTPTWSGTLNWTVTLRDTAGATASRSFTVIYTPPAPDPTLGLSPMTITGSLVQGSGWTTIGTVNVTNPGGGTLSWSETDNRAWISVSPSSGTTTTETDAVTVQATTTDLAVGTHTGTITFTGAGVTRTVNVTLTVTALPVPKPVIISPGTTTGPGQVIDDLTPTLRWNAVAGASHYALAISRHPYGAGDIRFYNPQVVHGTSHTVPARVLTHGGRYRWNMQAFVNGRWSPVSNTLYFRIGTDALDPPDISTLAAKAVENARSIVGAPYLGDGSTWGGKGRHWDKIHGHSAGEARWATPQEIKRTGYQWRQTGSIQPGIDCSGLIMWAYNRAHNSAGKYLDPANPILREGVSGQWSDTERIKHLHSFSGTNAVADFKEAYKSESLDLQPGDLIYFLQPPFGKWNHVVMYVGGGKVVHATLDKDKNGVVEERLEDVLQGYTDLGGWFKFVGLGRVKFGATPSAPSPKVVSVTVRNEISLGEVVKIRVAVKNEGEEANWQTIAISFPQNPTHVNVLGHNLTSAEVWWPGRETWGDYGTKKVTLVYPLAEGALEPWPSGKEAFLEVEVKPEKEGDFLFAVKTVAGRQPDGKCWARDPITSRWKDQQDEYVKRYKITVNPSLNQKPNSPVLVSPANNSCPMGRIVFEWDSVPNATNYKLFIKLPGSSSWLSDQTVSTSYPYSPTLIGYYHWKVKAYANGNWSDYSEERIFYFSGLPAPNLSSPPDNSETTDLRPSFQWNPVSDSNYYELQLARDSSFTDMVRTNLSIHGTSWCLDNQDLTAGQTYYWRVRSNSPIGQWSTIWSFAVKATHNLTIQMPSPPEGGSISPVAGIYTKNQNEAVLLTAHPNSGWQVHYWSGTDNDFSTATANTVTMTSDKTVRVYFEKIPIAVTGITLDQATLHMVADRNPVTLIATVFPADAANKAVSWSSDNENVATVNANGRVTPVATGTATITVTTEDGGYTAKCVVTVVTPVVPGATVTGQVDLPGRADDSGVMITVEGTDISTASTADGHFTLTGVPVGEQTLVFTKELFLVRKLTVDVPATGTLLLPDPVTLKPGDANNDNQVNIQDLTLLATAYRTVSGDDRYNVATDFNADGKVNIQDLTLLASSYRKVGD